MFSLEDATVAGNKCSKHVAAIHVHYGSHILKDLDLLENILLLSTSLIIYDILHAYRLRSGLCSLNLVESQCAILEIHARVEAGSISKKSCCLKKVWKTMTTSLSTLIGSACASKIWWSCERTF